MDQSLVDDEPSEASFSRHLEDQPRTAVSTPAKPEDLESYVSDENNTSAARVSKRNLELDCPPSPLALQGKQIHLIEFFRNFYIIENKMVCP